MLASWSVRVFEDALHAVATPESRRVQGPVETDSSRPLRAQSSSDAKVACCWCCSCCGSRCSARLDAARRSRCGHEASAALLVCTWLAARRCGHEASATLLTCTNTYYWLGFNGR